MADLIAMSRCPNCGAPLSVDADRRSVICIFCNTSLRVERPATGGTAAELVAEAVSANDIELVKQMLLDGRRDQAIDHYAHVASVSRAEAEKAVDNVFISAFWTLTRHMPINGFGFVLYGVLISLGLGPAAYGAMHLAEQPAYFALVALGGAFALYQFYGFWLRLRSRLVASFGAQGRGRVVRSSVVREVKERQAFIIVVVFEVVPDDGSASFVDQETLFVGAATRDKLDAGNILPVRFDGAREHVFPITPMTVVGTA